ncbi:MAG: dTDP-4-amino-4 [Thermodesulfobacterium sp.]|uniref:dTDP-4-amino-4 n=1 Tax=Candidatus Thermodesulfobacterium syntrophicum TaxID=3060442 RepID=A0AAE3P2M3_9BACT|nr:dTDP-4-amino-4 [Candidatus Thermodesulfobacterium syntrophicum]
MDLNKIESNRIGEIVFLNFPFTDLKGSKIRPALIIGRSDINEEDYVVAYITAELDKYIWSKYAVPLSKEDLLWGNLKYKCVIRVDKTILAHKYQFLKEKVAYLTKEKIDEVLRVWFKFQIVNYYKIFHKKETSFTPNKTHINYAGRVYDEREIINLVDSALDFWLTAGRFDKEFCKKISEYLGVKYVLTCNSGSSANLLAISALTSYKLGDLRLKPGDEVITVAAGFPTTIAPIIQNNLVPVFVDIELGTYNINPESIEEAISPKTRAIFLAHTLGIPFNLDKVLELAEKYNLWVIEDNCDALGAEYALKREYRLINNKVIKGRHFTGTFGHIGTSSFYPAHHITMGEGGAVYTDNTKLYKILLSFRDWGRDCWCEPGKDNTCGKRFSWKLGNLPKGYDHKYIYSHFGYNLKITDMQAAVGVAQLEKLPEFIKTRRKNWWRLYEGLKELEEFFILPHYLENSLSSPFGFVLTIRDKAPFTRKEIISYLEKKGIQTRMVFAGNILKQPAITEGNYQYRIIGDLKNTDKVMRDTFWLGVYPGLTEEMIDYIITCIKNFVKSK